MHLDEFDFELPHDLIAQEPPTERSGSRLLIASRRGDAPLRDARFPDLPTFLRAGDVLVVNRSRVVPARLHARRGDGLEVEVFFLRTASARSLVAWTRPMRRLREGDLLHVAEGTALVYAGRVGEREARFELAPVTPGTVLEVLEAHGHVPLPPYIRRADRHEDRDRYQTVFAREQGSVAAPTAGLHFDDALLSALAARGVHVASVVLHVGAGTFQPLDHDVVEANRLHAEHIDIDARVVDAVQSARREGRRVVAVGTTVARALETAAARGWLEAEPQDRSDETDMFLYPGCEFRAIDALVTNFHLPRSSLFVLVCAFMGRERALAAYRHAVAEGYRFYSYGDAMLIA